METERSWQHVNSSGVRLFASCHWSSCHHVIMPLIIMSSCMSSCHWSDQNNANYPPDLVAGHTAPVGDPLHRVGQLLNLVKVICHQGSRVHVRHFVFLQKTVIILSTQIPLHSLLVQKVRKYCSFIKSLKLLRFHSSLHFSI